MRIYHNSRSADYREPFGAAETGTKVSLSVDVTEANIEGVRLMVWQGEELSPAYYDMNDTGGGLKLPHPMRAACSGMRLR